MSSQSKIQSARANGARSRGPVTPEGKQKSSRNATRHGLLANTLVLEGESKERFEELLTSLTTELQPRSTIEAALVETMAAARWRWLRVLSIQKAQFDMEMARHPSVPSRPVRAAIAFKNLSDNSRALDVLLRYEVAFERQFYRALSTFMKVRASAQAQKPEILEFPIEPDQRVRTDCQAEANGQLTRSNPVPKLSNFQSNPIRPGWAGLQTRLENIAVQPSLGIRKFPIKPADPAWVSYPHIPPQTP